MPPRAILTILYFGASRAARVDVGANAEVLLSAERPASLENVASTAEQLLTESARPAAKTFIFFEGAWTQTIDLASAATSGLVGDPLHRAIAYELEPVSGIRALDAAVGVSPLGPTGDRSRFWVTEVDQTLQLNLDALLRRCHSILLGIAHPCGMIQKSGPSLEIWDQVTVCANTINSADGNGSVINVPTKLTSSRPGSRMWEQEVQDWLAAAGAAAPGTVTWTGRARAQQLFRDPAARAIRELFRDSGPHPADVDLFTWIRETAAPAIINKQLNIPFVPPAPRPKVKVRPFFVAAAVTAGVIAFCGWDFYDIIKRARDLEKLATETAEARASAERTKLAIDTLAKQLTDLNARNAALRARVEFVTSESASQRGRLSLLIKEAGERCPRSLYITEISPEAAGILKIRGAGSDGGAVDLFVSSLTPSLEKSRWMVDPAQMKEKWTDDGHRFFEFIITVTPAGNAPVFVAPTGAASRKGR